MLAFGATGPQLDATATPPLVVHVCADADVEEATLQRAADVAAHLLSTAVLTATWRVCERRGPSVTEARIAPDVVAILWSNRLGTESDRCGFAHRRAAAVGTALVSVRCVQEFTQRLARLSSYRSHPALAGGRHDDLLGVLVAHEIGHLFGLEHAPKGVMRARLDAEDVIAFRQDRLRFTPREAARIRTASADARVTLAKRRSLDQK